MGMDNANGKPHALILKEMRLINFKRIADLTVRFSDTVTEIRGANGLGKTTVFDAFVWLLFGKDSADRKGFSVKTLDNDGNAIPRLPHEVSARLSVGGEEVELTRRLNEKWTRRRGSDTETFTGNEEERLWNGVPLSVREWGERVSSLCDEEVFKYVTSPHYFCSQKWDVQRRLLLSLAGDVTDADVMASAEEFKGLAAELGGRDAETLRKEVAARKRRVKEEMDGIPARVDERMRDAEASRRDWDALAAKARAKEAEIAEAERRLSDMAAAEEAAGAGRVGRARELSERRMELQMMEAEMAARAADAWNAWDYRRREADAERARLSAEAGAADRRAAALATELEDVRAEWRAVSAEAPDYSSLQARCPTCGREFSPDETEARRVEIEDNWNRLRADRLRKISGRGHSVKEGLLAARSGAEEARRRMGDVPDAGPEPARTPDFKADAAWAALDAEIRDMEAAAAKDDAPSAGASETDAPRHALAGMRGELSALTAELALRKVWEANVARVEELQGSLRALGEELAALEGTEYRLSRLSRARMEMVEGRINGLFKTVRFKLFERQINGGEAETCVATVGGVPWPDLNSAGRVNCGLDIINAISRAKGVSAPIFIDNAEGVNELMETGGAAGSPRRHPRRGADGAPRAVRDIKDN